jgi:hypothetical protein
MFLILTTAGICLAQRPNCAGQGVFRAQDSLRRYCSWPVIYKFYRLYNACDNAYVTDAFSTAIVKALAEKWDSLPELRKISDADPAFLDFVLRHIDATADFGSLKRILENINNCRKGFESLCARIRKKTSAALEAAPELHE